MDWAFPSFIQDLLECWNISKISRKARILWSLVCSAVCWSIWLERNQQIIENQTELAYIVYKKAKVNFVLGELNGKKWGRILL